MKTPRGIMDYNEVIAQCMEVVARAERPLPKPCGKTKGCRLAGGCKECFAELLKGADNGIRSGD
jgi:hypothetical protein